MTLLRSLVIAFVLTQAILAGPPERALSEYHKQDWQVEDGLPHGNVRALAQDENGALLIGTGAGLAAFDGLRFTPVKIDDKDEFANEPANAVLRTRNGDLWIGTDGRGVIHRPAKGRAVNVSESAGLYQERVRALFEDSEGAVWAATQNGVERIVKDRVEYLSALGIVTGDMTTPFATDGSDGMFLVTAKGLFHWTGGAAKLVPIAYLGKGEPTAVLRDHRGAIWVGTERGAVRLEVRGGGWRARPVEGIHGPVEAMVADGQDNVWFGTRGHGLCRIALRHPEAKVTHWSSANGLSDDRIRSMFEDNEGNLWIGLLSGGLNRWRQTELIPYGQPEGLPDSFAAAVLQDRNQDVWLGTWGQGVFRRHQGQLETVHLPGVPASSPIRALAEDPKGGVWVGTWYDGVFLCTKGRVERFVTGYESRSNAVSALLVDRNGTLWVGTYNGLLKYEQGRPGRDRAQVLLSGKVVTCLKENAGQLLVGTTQGLYVLAQSFVTALTRKNGLSNDHVISISTDDAGAVWVATKAGGVDRLAAGGLTHIDAESGMPAYPISSVIDDGQGMLWMGSTRGLLRVSRTQLHAVSEGRAKTLDLTVLGRADGMRGSECGSLSQPPASRGVDGSLWFATAKGFVHTNPKLWDSTRVMPSPRPSIVGYSIGHQTFAASPLLTIPPGPRDVDIQFSAVRLSGPSQLKFRYKLEGYDSDWTVTQARHATYRQLPPGQFRFVLAVQNSNGDWTAGDQVASAEVEQSPYFHQRWWFYGILAIAVAGAVALFFRSRFARARERVAAVIEERNRIARDWHDTLMADFSAISWQLEATRYRLESGSSSEASTALDMARNMVKHCQAEARRIIWDLRNMDEPMGMLSQELAKVLCLMGPRAEQGTEVYIEGEERPLPPVFVHHLVCIGQEAVSNALRHASPKSIRIHLTYGTERVSLTVEDNGDGFAVSSSAVQNSTTGHFGLAVMQERARKIGGELKIRSTPGTGTEVRVDIPARQAL